MVKFEPIISRKIRPLVVELFSSPYISKWRAVIIDYLLYFGLLYFM